MCNTWDDDVKFGKIAAGFVNKYKDEVTGLRWLFFGDVTREGFKFGDDAMVTGADIKGCAVCFGEEDKLRMLGLAHIEVKGSRDSRMLSFYKYGNWRMPTIPFEIWSNADHTTRGWLYAMAHPAEQNAYNIQNGALVRAHTPGVFIWVCYCNDTEPPRPYMAITMQNFSYVYNELKEYAQKTLNWDLEQWNLPPSTDEQYWKGLSDKYIVRGNVWNVPLDVVMKAANVYITMIDDPPANMDEDQRVRYEVFKKYAEGHRLLTREVDEIRLARENALEQMPITSEEIGQTFASKNPDYHILLAFNRFRDLLNHEDNSDDE